jgi:hypothetical protein
VPYGIDKGDLECTGPDLRDAFGDDLTSEIDDEGQGGSTSTSNDSAPVTPEDSGLVRIPDLEPHFAETDDVEESAIRKEIVANGWRNKWAFVGKRSMVSACSLRCGAFGFEG